MKNPWIIISIILGGGLVLILGILVGQNTSSSKLPNLTVPNAVITAVVTKTPTPTPTRTQTKEIINSDETSLNYDNGESLRNGVYKSQELIEEVDGGVGYLLTLIGFAKDKKIFTGEFRFVYQNGSVDEEPEMVFLFYDEGLNGSSVEWPGFPEKNDANWYRKSITEMGIQFNCKGKLKFYKNEEICRFYFAGGFPE